VRTALTLIGVPPGSTPSNRIKPSVRRKSVILGLRKTAQGLTVMKKGRPSRDGPKNKRAGGRRARLWGFAVAGPICVIESLVRLCGLSTPFPAGGSNQSRASRPVSSCSRLRRCISRRRSSNVVPVHQQPTMRAARVTASFASIGISSGWRGLRGWRPI
jgi:hypothetical protein